MKACILLPVYNDWPCLPKLLVEIDQALVSVKGTAEIIIINDGGDPPSANDTFFTRHYAAITRFHLIDLVRNVGNQNALAIGLSFIRDEIECEFVAVMDSDGQDAPAHLPLLIDAYLKAPQRLITAERSNRSEGLLFRTCYKIYKLAFRALTGKRLSFGNYSIIPSRYLPRLTVMAELPLNFAAALIKSRIPIHCVPCDRGDRYDGVTSQNFVGLIIHGINGVSVFSEVALVRVSLSSAFIILSSIIGISITAAIRLLTDLAVPGWASNVVGFFLIVLFQGLLLSLVAIFVRVQRPMSLVVDPAGYKFAIASVSVIKLDKAIRASA